LFTITTFEFFEDKNHQEGYDHYVLSTRLWLTIEPEVLEWNTKFKQDNTSFKLVKALVDQEMPSKVSIQEIQEWEEFKFEPAEAVIKTALFIAKRLCQIILR
jgi:hypothetical protein